MTTITGYAAGAAGQSLEQHFYAAAPLGPDDIFLTTEFCGICHSDIHLIDNDWGVSSYPLVPGHEIVGVVADVGSHVTGVKRGQRVAVGWQSGSCHSCEWCLRGEENLCADNRATCVGRPGGFASAIVTDSRFAFTLPDKLDPAAASPLLCGGITVYSPLRRHVLSSMRVGVIGIGGLGHLALQFARAMGCEVTAFSTSPKKEKEARDFGAHHFVDSSDEKQMKAAMGSLDFILSTVYTQLSWQSWMSVLRPNGKICFVGAAGNLDVPVFMVMTGQKSIVGSVIGGRPAIREMLEFSARHGISAMIEEFPMSNVNEAIERLRHNDIRYRAVLKNTL